MRVLINQRLFVCILKRAHQRTTFSAAWCKITINRCQIYKIQLSKFTLQSCTFNFTKMYIVYFFVSFFSVPKTNLLRIFGAVLMFHITFQFSRGQSEMKRPQLHCANSGTSHVQFLIRPIETFSMFYNSSSQIVTVFINIRILKKRQSF